jgi:hypothetical protein
MSLHALSKVRIPDEAVHGGARHLRVWLAASGRSYDAAARELFVRAHAELFGCAYDLTLRGYDRWRWRNGVDDSVDGFARYVAPRHQRWMMSRDHTPGMPACLLGTSRGQQPCWTLAGDFSSPAEDQLRLSA